MMEQQQQHQQPTTQQQPHQQQHAATAAVPQQQAQPLFGGRVLLSLLLESANLPPLPDEQALLAQVRDRLGPYASHDKLTCHLRAARGRLGWAVNTYLRAVLAAAPAWGPETAAEDFDPPPSAAAAAGAEASPAAVNTSTNGPAGQEAMEVDGSPPVVEVEAADAAVAAAAEQAAAPLDALPASVLEQVLSHLGDARALAAAARTCQALQRAAAADSLWQQLFEQRWGSAVFPTAGGGGGGSRQPGNSSSSPLQQPGSSRAVAGEASSAAAQHARAPVSRFAAPTAAAQHQQQQNQRGMQPPPPHPAQHQQHQQQPPPPAGSWRAQFRQQHAYAAARRCPMCAAPRAIRPLCYGFPSAALLTGNGTRLVLAGDHLIDDSHVWTCAACRGCFRWHPYSRPDLWLRDAEAAAAAAARAGAAAVAAQGGAGGQQQPMAAAGGGQQQQQQQQHHGAGGGSQETNLPPYTYEL